MVRFCNTIFFPSFLSLLFLFPSLLDFIIAETALAATTCKIQSRLKGSKFPFPHDSLSLSLCLSIFRQVKKGVIFGREFFRSVKWERERERNVERERENGCGSCIVGMRGRRAEVVESFGRVVLLQTYEECWIGRVKVVGEFYPVPTRSDLSLTSFGLLWPRSDPFPERKKPFIPKGHVVACIRVILLTLWTQSSALSLLTLLFPRFWTHPPLFLTIPLSLSLSVSQFLSLFPSLSDS